MPPEKMNTLLSFSAEQYSYTSEKTSGTRSAPEAHTSYIPFEKCASKGATDLVNGKKMMG